MAPEDGRNVRYKLITISALAFAYSAAKYAAPVWTLSKSTHKQWRCNKIMRVIADAFDVPQLSIFWIQLGIPSSDFRKEAITAKYVSKVFASDDYTYSKIVSQPALTVPSKTLSPFRTSNCLACLQAIRRLNSCWYCWGLQTSRNCALVWLLKLLVKCPGRFLAANWLYRYLISTSAPWGGE